MATRTITSPGVEIRERDLSLIAPQTIGTSVFVTGYADQGPIDELVKITTRDELDLIYGTPTNSAERYFYHTVRELLNSPANIYTSRLPYGAGSGVGFGSKYSALAYPVAVYSLSSYSLTLPNTTQVNLSGSQFSLVLSDNKTYTFGFSGVGFNPTNSSLDGYALFATSIATQTSTSIINAISSVVSIFDPTATYLSAGTVLTITPSKPVTNASFSFSLSDNMAGTGNTSSSNKLDINGGSYVLGKPVHFELTETQYNSIVDGSGFTWSPQASSVGSINTVAAMGGAGVIIVNKAQTVISNQLEGYYIGLTDNMFINPGSDYKSVRGVKSLTNSFDSTYTYIDVPTGTLQFSITSQYQYGGDNSISQALENIADYDITGRTEDDLLGVGVFKLRKSLFANEAFKLDYFYEDRLLGSIDYYRDTTSANGGPTVNYFIGNEANKSRNVSILVNDNLSNRLVGKSIGTDGIPKKKIRVLSRELIDSNDPTASGIPTATLQTLTADTTLGYGDYLYPLGAYGGQQITNKLLGDIPSKLDRSLDSIRNEDLYDIDVVVEAGLGTIYAAASGAQTSYYDEFNYNTSLKTQVDALRSANSITTDGETIRNNYSVIFNKFNSFCSPLYIGGGRGDCLFIADPLRHIYVTGVDNKVSKRSNYIFQRDTYWATRHQFENANTSYATTYANWAKVYDSFSGQQVWVPFSGFAAAVMARTDAATFPWIAPAGFENGLIQTATDIASTPNQKQRDELYKSNLNPITFFPVQGQVVFGQKTLSRKPSAFDRINVRRLFLALERPTRKAAQYFVFQPNTTFTRTRLVNVLTPIFERARNNEGVYEYLIVCDERNNTPEVIDNNELVVDIYIKPVRASEFILINFVATRTDANFQEIIGG